MGAPRVQQNRPARSSRVLKDQQTTVVQPQLCRRLKASSARELALRNRLEDLLVLVLVECAMRLGAHVPLRANRQRTLRDYVVARRLDDKHRIVLTHHRVEILHLGAVLMKGLLRRVDPVARRSQMIKSLMSEMKKDHICRHRKITSAIFRKHFKTESLRQTKFALDVWLRFASRDTIVSLTRKVIPMERVELTRECEGVQVPA